MCRSHDRMQLNRGAKIGRTLARPGRQFGQSKSMDSGHVDVRARIAVVWTPLQSIFAGGQRRVLYIYICGVSATIGNAVVSWGD